MGKEKALKQGREQVKQEAFEAEELAVRLLEPLQASVVEEFEKVI